MISGNKGEWSEIYTLFKLLGDGKVYAGDADLNKLSLYYPILNVVRQESKRMEYKPCLESNIVVISEDGFELTRFPMSKFHEESLMLLTEINDARTSSFSVEKTERFMKTVGCTRLKAPSADKADIHIIIHDLRTNMTPNLGFSIKSQLGEPSTLLNPGFSTNIRFRIVGLEDDIIASDIQEIEGHLERVQRIYNLGYYLEYDDIIHPIFKNNLLFIDSFLPRFIGLCLIANCTGDCPSDIKTIVQKVALDNPFNYGGSNKLMYYEHKMKQLLIASALGMTPAREWNGRYDANGGYLVVRRDGEIVCYHFYNQNDVEDYLYNNTKIERASRSRYQFGSLYKQNGQYYFNLNLQIRFKR